MKTICIKLLHDTLFLTLIAFGVTLLADIILPGFLTRFVSLSTFILVIAAILASTTLLTSISRHCKEPSTQQKTARLLSRRTALIATAVTLLATATTMYHFTWWEVAIILTLLATLAVSLVHSDPTKSA